ncbi:MAG: carbohydrate porin [Pseudomonadota bacterium]
MILLGALALQTATPAASTDSAPVAESVHSGAHISGALLLVGQHATHDTPGDPDKNAGSLRADLELELPLGHFGTARGLLYAHARAGRENALESLGPMFTGAVNSTAFGDEDGGAKAILAQVWYQLALPLGMAGDASGQLEFALGKIDPFGFFDQNALADDESEAFLNNVFVHNPLLDSGGDIGGDAYGFAPGVRLAYTGSLGAERSWAASLGLFGAGSDVSFERPPGDPLSIVQAEYAGPTLGTQPGSYRLYAWRNRRATPFNNEADIREETHTGWGVSADQRLTETAGVFARYGHSTRGYVAFDRALTLGLQVSGSLWGREDDALGLAWGWLRSSSAFRQAAPVLDADADTVADFGYVAAGSEQQAELFYNWRPNPHLLLTPDVQWIRRPGGDAAANNAVVWSLRIKASF